MAKMSLHNLRLVHKNPFNRKFFPKDKEADVFVAAAPAHRLKIE